MSQTTKHKKGKGELGLVKNKELEKTIETIVKRDTPDREVYFDNRTHIHDNNIYIYVFKVFTKKHEDPFPLLLKEKRFDGGAFGHEDFESFRHEFLEELRNELVSEEEKATENRYLVKWQYESRDKKGNEVDPVERTSHFMGKDVKEVVNKLEESIPKDYRFKVHKIELLPES